MNVPPSKPVRKSGSEEVRRVVRRLRKSAGPGLVLAGMLLLPLAAMQAQSVGINAEALKSHDPFAVLHLRLDAAADRLVASAGEAVPVGVGDTPARTPRETTPTEQEIEQFSKQHWNGRLDSLRQALERVQSQHPTLQAQLREEGLPAELAAVVLVESAGQAAALSPRGARGPWQFMPETARRYGLRVDSVHDDRTDWAKSTRAAARYLRDLADRFGDWHLALAAYNAGEGAVQAAIRRARTADFQQISGSRLLPRETRQYVPAVLHAADLLGDVKTLVDSRPQDPILPSAAIIYATPSTSE